MTHPTPRHPVHAVHPFWGLALAAGCVASAYPVACAACELLVRVGVGPKQAVDLATVVLAVLMAPVPALIAFASFARWDAARRDRRAQGLCMHCGYDCHVTPDRCPECGRCPTSMGG